MSNHNELPEGVTREEMEVDVLIVGGGAAGLSCALQLSQQIEKHNADIQGGHKQGELIPEQMIVVIEKASEIGAHSFSGAVLKTDALKELVPNFKEENCPLDAEVTYDEVRYLGFCEIFLGLIAAFLPGYGLQFWAIGFGVLHIVYGIIMYHKYDK